MPSLPFTYYNSLLTGIDLLFPLIQSINHYKTIMTMKLLKTKITAPSYLQNKTQTQLHTKNHSLSSTILFSPYLPLFPNIYHVPDRMEFPKYALCLPFLCISYISASKLLTSTVHIYQNLVFSRLSLNISFFVNFPWSPNTERNLIKIPRVDLNFSNDMTTFLIHTVVTFVNSSLKDSLPCGARIFTLFTAVQPEQCLVPSEHPSTLDKF